MEPTDPRIPQQATALAKTPRTIKDLIQSKEFESAVKMALPKHVTVERFMRVALNATMRQPELAECSKESFFLRMLELSSLGLEPDGRRAHLIPFWNNKVCANCNHPTDQHKGPICQIAGCPCKLKSSRREVQLIVDYKGLAELVRRSGDVSYMHADVVHQKDEWEFAYGSGAVLKHKPNLDADDRGRPICAYSFVKLRDGNEDFIVMSVRDIEKVRERSKAANSGPWVSDWSEMAKKTVFRRHSKWLPLSPEIKDAVEVGDDAIDAIDSSGALALAGETVTGLTNEGRLEQQIHDQSFAEDKPTAETPQSTPQPQDTQQQQEEPKQDKPSSANFLPPWPNKVTMRTAFEMLHKQLNDDKAFYGFLGNEGIENLDVLVLNAASAKKAFADIQAEIADRAGTQESEQDDNGGFLFGKGGKK